MDLVLKTLIACGRKANVVKLAAAKPTRIKANSSHYDYSYSNDNGITFKTIATTASDLILSNYSYTGAHLGLYINSLDNQQRFIDIEDFSIKYNSN